MYKVSEVIELNALVLHLLTEIQGLLPLPGLLTDFEDSAVGNHIRAQPQAWHLLPQMSSCSKSASGPCLASGPGSIQKQNPKSPNPHCTTNQSPSPYSAEAWLQEPSSHLRLSSPGAARDACVAGHQVW